MTDKIPKENTIWPQLDQDAITKRWKELYTMNNEERIRHLFGEWKCEDTTFNAKTMREDDDDRQTQTIAGGIFKSCP